MTHPHGTAGALAARPVTPLGILAAGLDDLCRRVDALDGIDAEFRAELHAARDLAGGLDPYVEQCTTPESAPLRLLAERTQAEDWGARSADGRPAPLEQEMLSGHVEGQALKFLVHLTRAARVLEIGMFTGYSALAMAEALPVDGRLIACEIDSGVAEFARRCFDESPHGHKISVEVAPALDTLAGLAAAGESFELIFIDADKPNYGAYLDAVLAGGLLAPHGVVCVDNTLLQGRPYLPADPGVNGAAIAGFNAKVAADPRLEQVLVPLRDGLSLIRRV